MDEPAEQDARIIVGWLLDIVLNKGRGQHEFDVQLAVTAAKQFLGVKETAQ